MNDPLPPSRPLRVLHAAASTLWWLLVVAWLVLVLAWTALHGWIVPRIGELRPMLESHATQALGIPVRIGSVSARSDSLMPSFELRDVVMLDGHAREALRLSRVTAALSPRSLWNLGFEQLVIEQPALDIRRLSDGRLQVAGLDLSASGGDGRAADWFFRQKEVLVLGGTVRWTDEMRDAPPLALQDVQLVVRNGLRRHALRLDATPPADWGGRLSVRGLFRQPLLSAHPGRWEDWDGQVFADFTAVDLSRLRQYASLGIEVGSGRGALRAWADVDRGSVTGGTADLFLSGVQAQLAPDRPALQLASLAGRLSGKWRSDGWSFETQRLQFETAQGLRWPGGNIEGSWNARENRRPEQGQLRGEQLDLEALRQVAGHLPLSETARQWLADQGPSGRLERIQANWEGPLERLTKYQARGRLSDLALPAHPATQRPGLRGATLDFDFTEAGGQGRLQLNQGALELTGILEEPLLPVDTLEADLQWQQSEGRLRVSATGLRFRNADTQAEGQLVWRTGETAQDRFPGVLDLQLTLPRADGARVWRYLPLSVPKATRDYVREAVLAGRTTDGRVRVRGNLRDFPFKDPRTGEFRISTRFSNLSYAYVPRGPGRGAGQWAALTGLSGELLFERSGMQVRGAQGRLAGAPGLQVQAEADLPELSAGALTVNGLVRGPLAESLAVFKASPVASSLGPALSAATATGNAEVRLRLALPLSQLDRSTVQGSVTLAGNDLQVTPEVPMLARARGVVSFTERSFTLAGVQGRALGGDLRIDGGTRVLPPGSGEAPALLRLQGTATAEGLRQARELGPLTRLARQASGSAAYSATLGLRPGAVDIAVTSSLQGLALSLPPPLNKTAEAALPLRFELAALPGSARPQDQLTLELGRLATASYVRDVGGPTPQVLRGALAVGLASGETAPLPAQGVQANINLSSVNLDDWQAVLEAAAGPASAGAAAMAYLPTSLALRARALTLDGRTLDDVVVGGSREGLLWRVNVYATQLNGYFEYRQPSAGSNGRLVARLARLSIAAATAGDVETLLDAQPASIPSLDVVVDEFELRGKKLGRLEIDALNRGAPAGDWRLIRLALTLPEASFSATGNWAAAAGPRNPRAGSDRRRTEMNFRLDVADAGQLLTRLGMPDGVRRGRGRLEGQVAWLGSPLSLDYPSMTGAFSVNIEAGQFLKADPGLAKLLGVLSLQSLPRRLTLDFRDVFSEGFAFDFVRGDISIAQGIASTNNLQMKGVNAAVLMEGRADIARETQELRVLVVPEINAGTASLVASVINPAIGLGTFLAQLFLREPLMRAATQEFQIDGTWADPRITRINRPAPPVPGAN